MVTASFYVSKEDLALIKKAIEKKFGGSPRNFSYFIVDVATREAVAILDESKQNEEVLDERDDQA